jgi:hypothetical protein
MAVLRGMVHSDGRLLKWRGWWGRAGTPSGIFGRAITKGEEWWQPCLLKRGKRVELLAPGLAACNVVGHTPGAWTVWSASLQSMVLCLRVQRRLELVGVVICALGVSARRWFQTSSGRYLYSFLCRSGRRVHCQLVTRLTYHKVFGDNSSKERICTYVEKCPYDLMQF